jgi:hypothetical protein|eukprot:SAG25_NODE_456_length_7858_cov_3.295657_5_plen_68_part_00
MYVVRAHEGISTYGPVRMKAECAVAPPSSGDSRGYVGIRGDNDGRLGGWGTLCRAAGLVRQGSHHLR